MLIEHEWHAYNDRRYSRPWAAKVTFVGVKPQYDFIGRYASGRLAFEADPGDIIAMGQKDNRGKGTSKDFYVVRDADINWLKGGEGEAFTLWRQAHAEPPKTADEMAGVIDDAMVELHRLRQVNAALVEALRMAHDEIHHPGAAAHRGEDFDAMIRTALSLAKGEQPAT